MSTPQVIPSSALPNIDLNPTIGALLIGLILASIFEGITTMQTIHYYTIFPDDSLFLKLMVLSVWLLDMLSLAMISHAIYTFVILDFMDPLALMNVPWSIGVSRMTFL